MRSMVQGEDPPWVPWDCGVEEGLLDGSDSQEKALRDIEENAHCGLQMWLSGLV